MSENGQDADRNDPEKARALDKSAIKTEAPREVRWTQHGRLLAPLPNSGALPRGHEGWLRPEISIRMESAKQLILDAKRARAAFSLVRLGDGEGAFLGYPEYSSEAERGKFLKLWWGTDAIAEESCQQLKEDVFEASRNASLLGIPAHDHPKHQLMRNVYRIVADQHLYTPETLLTSSLIAINLYRDQFLKKLIHGEEDVGLISPNVDLSFVLTRDFGVKSATCIEIAGEHKWFGGRQHFPNEYYEMASRIEVKFPGMIFLIGAGICGKVYAELVRRAGGIGLDVGSVLDHWAGRKTRNIHKDWE